MIYLVNFHYVRERAGRFARLNGRTPGEFRAQLDTLLRRAQPLGFDGLSEWLSRRDRGLQDAERFCLTFDDGLAEHASFVADELEARGIPAAFFVPTATWEGRVLGVHKLHLVMAVAGDAELLQAVRPELKAVGLDVDAPEFQAQAVQTYRYDAASPIAAVKFALNHCLSGAHRERVVDSMFETYVGDERRIASELYMSPVQCRSLARRGFVVGLHSHSHANLANLDSADLRRDLERNMDILGSALGTRPVSIAYPYGSDAAVSNAVVEAAAGLGLTLGFTTIPGFVNPGDDRLRLKRLDTNDAPGGKAPRTDLGF